MIGVLVASHDSYLADPTSLGQALSAALAIVLWPLVLLCIHLNLA